MDIPLPDDIPLPQGMEEPNESEETSNNPAEESTNESENLAQESNNLAEESNLENVDIQKKEPSNPIAIEPNISVAPPNQPVSQPNHHFSKPPPSLGMLTVGGLPNLNQPPPSLPNFSKPPPGFGFPPLNQPPPGMNPYSQPPPSILHHLRGPPPPPILKSIINESETSSTQERYSPTRVTVDDDEPPAVKTEEILQGQAVDTQTVNVTDKKVTKIPPKVRPSLLGKLGAKKRLMAFSGKTSFNISKTSKVTAGSVLEENDEAEKSSKKPPVVVVKKKKEEKISMIEHIRDEETRIKEAIGLKQFNLPFSLYGPGLFPIQKLLDNPEELRKFEEKAKGMPDRLAAYEQKEKKRLEEKDKDKEKDRQREKDKRKERESGRSKDGENEKAKKNDKRNEDDIRRKQKFIPKNWKEFKDNNITFEDIKHIFREKQENRSRDRGRQNFVNDIEAKLLFPLTVKSKNRGVMDKEFPGHMISNTNTKPNLTFSINPSKYIAHFLTRYELKHHKSLESWTLLKEFWNSVSNHSIVYSSETEGIDSRQWWEKPWNIESICDKADLRADAQDVKNREQTDIDIKSRWDSDNEVDENASRNEEKYKKSSDSTKKESRNVKEGQFSDGLNDEYDLFLKSLDDEDGKSKKRSIKENKVKDDRKDETLDKKSKDEGKFENNINEDENKDDDICNKVTDETIRKDQDSDVNNSVEPKNDMKIKKKKNKKLKKQKDIEKKKKKEEKKAKKKAKKAKKKLKKQKEKDENSRKEKTSDFESQENKESTTKSSPATRNTIGYDENSGSCYGDDDKYNDDSWSKYHQEKLTGSPDSRYANSVCKNENNSPYINESREFYEDQLDNDEKHISRSRRPNKEYYQDDCSSSREDKLGKSYEEQFSKRNFNPLAYGKSLIKKEYPQSLSVSDYDSDEYEHKYSKEKFLDSKDTDWKMHRNEYELGKPYMGNYDREINKDRERKDILRDSKKEYKEISNKLERYNSEDDYDRKYKKDYMLGKDDKHKNDLEGKSYTEKESHYSRYEYELRKDEMDYRNKEKMIHKDLGGYNSDSENDEKYNNSYDKHISHRNVRNISEYSDFRQSSKYDKISDKEFDKSDRSHKDFMERESEYMSEVDQIPIPSNIPQSDIPFPSKASEDSKGISHQSYRSHKESGNYRTANEVKELTDKQNDKTGSYNKKNRNVNSPIAFKLSGSKYSGQQYKTHPGFALEVEQDAEYNVSNKDFEDEDNSDKEDHVVGSLADTLRSLRQIGSGLMSVKEIEKNRDKNHYDSKQYTTASYQREEDSLKWKDKYPYQKDFSPGEKQHHGYERLHRGRSEEENHRYQSHSSKERSHSSRERTHSSRERSHSSRERSPRPSSLRSSQIRKKMSPRRSPSPTREISPTEKIKYSDRNHQYNKSPDHKKYYEEHRSKYYDDKRTSTKYNFEESHHHDEQNEFETPEHSSYESYSTRKEKYSIERERSPAFKDIRQKHMSPDYSSRGGYERDYDREKSPTLEKQRHKHSYSRENLSKDESLNMGYYSSEEDDKIGHFKQSSNISPDRKERQFNSGYSYTTAEFESTSESKSSDRKRPNSCFENENERYMSRNEESSNQGERKWYDDRPSSHDREFYRGEGDRIIDRKETYRSRPEPSSDRILSPNRRYRERSGEIYNSSDKIERDINKVIKRSPSRKEGDQRSRSPDREKREFVNYSSNDHDNGSYDRYMASPNRKERCYEEKINQEKDSYSYNRAGDRSPELNHLGNKQSNSLQLESKQRSYSPESYNHVRKHSYNEYSTSPNTYEYVRSKSPSSSSGSIQAELQTSNESKIESSQSQWSNRNLKELPRESRSPSREESSSKRIVYTTLKSRSSTSRSKSPPTHIKSTAKRSISPRPKSPSPKILRSPRRMSEFSSKSSRSPTRTSRIYSPSRSESPSRRISHSPHMITMQSRSPHNQPDSPSRQVRLSSTSSRMSISPERKLSRSPHRSSKSPQRIISKSPQRLLASTQRMLQSPHRKSRSPSNRPLQSHHVISSPHRPLSPHRQYLRSPNRRLSRSPQRRLSRSPQRRQSRSPERRLSRSPQRILKSPQRGQSRSPHRKLSRSPNKIISPSQERRLSRSPIRKPSQSPEQVLRSPNLSPRSPLRIGELTSIASINISRDYGNIKLPDDIKQTLRNIAKIPEADGQYERNSTNENSKISLPDDHGVHGAKEETKIPVPDDKERQGSKEYSEMPLPIIHDKHEATKHGLNDENLTWDQEKKGWLPSSSEVVDTNTHNENENKVSSEKISLSESTVKIDADSTISDSELTGHQESPVTRESSSSPPQESPRRLTLDERLTKEHGITVQEEKPENSAMNQLYKWAGYPLQPSQVIQVGNMIEILPRSVIEQVTNSTKIIPTKSGEILASASSSSDALSGLIGQQQNTVTSTANVSLPINLALINSSVDKSITSEALVALTVLNKEIVQKYSEIDPQIQANSVLINNDVNIIAKEQLKLKRRELKERRRQEREARREKRRLKAIEQACREAIAAVASEQHQKGFADDAEEEALIREAMFETPNLGSPVPDYEVIDEEEEEKEEEARARRQKRLQPVPLPPITDKGILMSPSYRARDDYHPKSVKFADGVLPGEGTSPSGGEEIHSPPPPTFQTNKTSEKKLRKKRRVKIKMIKQYGVGPDEDFSPPPPPPGDPVFSIKLFPGFDHHYKATATGAAMIYTQPVLNPGLGGVIGVPGVPMVGFSRIGDAVLLGSKGVSSPSVTLSPGGPIVPSPVTFQLPTGCAYNAESLQFIQTATQPTASTLVDSNLSKSN